MQQLTGMDTSFLHLETPTQPMHVGSLVIYDQSTAPGGLVTFKDILRHFERRLGLARCFRQKLVEVPFGLDRPYWIEDDDFDLEFHIRHIALPKPGDWRQLCIQTARLMSRPLDMSRPLWEVTVIEGLDAVEGLPTGSYGVVTKIHHAAIDGMSGAEIFAAVHDLAPGETREVDDRWKPESSPPAIELVGRAMWNNVRRPLRAAEAVGRTVPAVRDTVQGLRAGDLRLPSTRVPSTPFSTEVSAHRVFDGRTFALDDVKAIRHAVEGATVNDVVLSVVGGALRRYLHGRGELPDESLVAMAPVSTRSDEQRGAAGNEISSMLVALGTDIDDPVERLAAVHQATVDSKALDRAIGAAALTNFTEFGPMRLASRAARAYARAGLLSRAALPMHTVVTNVPGPQFPLYLDHAEVVAMYGLGPIVDGVGLIQPVFSYNGKLSISFTGCRRQLPDPHVYAAALADSFTELRDAAGVATSDVGG